MAPTLLAQLSDPHVGGDGGAEDRLAAAVRSVLALRPAPDAVVVTGDLTEHGAPDEYARVHELLAPLPMPVHVLPGNHDARGALREVFGVPGDGDAPVRYAVPVGADLRLVVIDTIWPDFDDGHLGAEDLAWLEEALAADRDTPTVVAMHHPPIRIGIDPLDELGLGDADRDAFAAIVAQAPQVCRVVAGHVHRGAFAMLGSVPVFSCPSTYLQGRLEIGPGPLELVWQPPAFALHVLLDGVLVTHVQPVQDSR